MLFRPVCRMYLAARPSCYPTLAHVGPGLHFPVPPACPPNLAVD